MKGDSDVTIGGRKVKKKGMQFMEKMVILMVLKRFALQKIPKFEK